MDATQEPATEKQLSFLRQSGYTPSHSLTRSQACDLLRQLQQHPGQQVSLPEDRSPADAEAQAFHLRKAVESARCVARELNIPQAKAALEMALSLRQEFWADTCRELTQMKASSQQIIALYRQWGCRFETPTHEQVEEILEALDAALPTWDFEHPELFYQTLELNFKELLRHASL